MSVCVGGGDDGEVQHCGPAHSSSTWCEEGGVRQGGDNTGVVEKLMKVGWVGVGVLRSGEGDPQGVQQ